MNPPKCDDLDYIHFLIAAQKVFTCTETARCQPQTEVDPAHDAFTRLLQRQPLYKEPLWQEGRGRPCAYPLVDRKKGLSVLDDTTLDKPYAKKIDLVTYHFSGKHQNLEHLTKPLLACPACLCVLARRQVKEFARLSAVLSRPFWAYTFGKSRTLNLPNKAEPR